MKNLRTIGLALSFLIFAMGHSALGGSLSAGVLAGICLEGTNPRFTARLAAVGIFVALALGICSLCLGKPSFTSWGHRISSNWLFDLGLYLSVAGAIASLQTNREAQWN